jgi:hypothetical protein
MFGGAMPLMGHGGLLRIIIFIGVKALGEMVGKKCSGLQRM